MKKIIMLIIVGVVMTLGSSVSASNVGEKILLYIPNRVVDFCDLISVSLGIGGTFRAELMATEAVQVGGAYDWGSYRVYKDWNRQYGVGREKGYYWSLVCAGQEDINRYDTYGTVDEFYETFTGVPNPEQPIYNYYEGKRDYWRIGGALGFGLEGELYINPIEWADFVLGFFLIDIRQDDMEAVDF